MYSEEVDLCHRLKRAGWRIVYAPEAVVIHYEGRSSGQVLTTRNLYFFQSKIRYGEKYFGAPWASAFRIFMLAVFGSQWMIEAGKWLLGSQREMRLARIHTYRHLLASGLRAHTKSPRV
jgi:hypothetical protein